MTMTTVRRPQCSVVNLFSSSRTALSMPETDDEPEIVILDVVPSINRTVSTTNRTIIKKKSRVKSALRNRVLMKLSQKGTSTFKKDKNKKLHKSKNIPEKPKLLIDLTGDENDIDLEVSMDDIQFLDDKSAETAVTSNKEKIQIDLTEDSLTEDVVHKKKEKRQIDNHSSTSISSLPRVEELTTSVSQSVQETSASTNPAAVTERLNEGNLQHTSLAQVECSLAAGVEAEADSSGKEDTSVVQKQGQQHVEKPSTSKTTPDDHNHEGRLISCASDSEMKLSTYGTKPEDKPGTKLSEDALHSAKKDISKPDPEDFCKLYVGQLDERTTNESLRKYFQQYGTLLDAVVKTDPQTNRSKRYGFVIYTHKHMVDNVQKNRPHIVDGRLVCCRRRVPMKARSLPTGFMTKLFLVNLREGIKERDLKDYFEQFGEVLNCKIISQGIAKRFGFVTFRDYDSSDKVLVLKGHTIKGQYIEPQIFLTREQMAERELKFYLKYFGGFSTWSIPQIENHIRQHPELRQADMVSKSSRFGHNQGQTGYYSYEGMWNNGSYNYRHTYVESGNPHNRRIGPIRNSITNGRYSPYAAHSMNEPLQSPQTSYGCTNDWNPNKIKLESNFDSDSEEFVELFVKSEWPEEDDM